MVGDKRGLLVLVLWIVVGPGGPFWGEEVGQGVDGLDDVEKE